MERTLIKANAKRYLSGKYGDALGVVVITSLLGGMAAHTLPLMGGSSSPIRFISENGMLGLDEKFQLTEWLEAVRDFIFSFVLKTWFLILLAALMFLVVPLYKLLVSNVIAVGRERWFLRSTHLDIGPPVRLMFSPFRGGEYGKVAGGMFWRSLWLYLWTLPVSLGFALVFLPLTLMQLYAFAYALPFSEATIHSVARSMHLPLFLYTLPAISLALLLMIIFGIVGMVKKYQYSMVPYLLADNPALGGRRALKLSKAMTRGRLWGLYVLDLSFIGWILLCSLCICMPWVTLHLFAPYYYMTWAETYNRIRDESAGRGILTMEELGYLRVF